MIKAKDLYCQQGSKVILNGVSFEIMKGKITAFVGPSGAGKTSLLRCIAGLHAGCTGTVTYEGDCLSTMSSEARSLTVGLVLQQFHLFSHLTVLQNCTFPMIAVQKKSPLDAEGDAMEVLSSLGIGHLRDQSPKQLSGGQMQRVAIARALVLRPRTLLLDEPTSALDPERRDSIASILLQLQAEGVTVAISTHDMPFVKGLASRMYFMEEGAITEEFDREKDDLSSKTKISKYLGA